MSENKPANSAQLDTFTEAAAILLEKITKGGTIGVEATLQGLRMLIKGPARTSLDRCNVWVRLTKQGKHIYRQCLTWAPATTVLNVVEEPRGWTRFSLKSFMQVFGQQIGLVHPKDKRFFVGNKICWLPPNEPPATGPHY
jgi:hypothetical protein